jgi:hypothetical protein
MFNPTAIYQFCKNYLEIISYFGLNGIVELRIQIQINNETGLSDTIQTKKMDWNLN